MRQGAHLGPTLAAACADVLSWNRLLASVNAYSLLKRQPKEKTLSIHRLVQAVQIDTMTQEEQQQWAERVVRVVNSVFPQNPKEEVATWPHCLRYLEQAQRCDTLSRQYRLLLPEVAHLLYRTGMYLYIHASYTLAEPLYQQVRRIWEHHLGPESPQVANPLHELANLYWRQGKYAEAEPLFQRVLRIREQQLGPEHLDVAYSLTGLAHLYRVQGRYVEAEPLFERALALREQHLGALHRETADVLHDFAVLREAQGRAEEAATFYQHALAIREQVFGPDHALTRETRENYVALLREMGRQEEADALESG